MKETQVPALLTKSRLLQTMINKQRVGRWRRAAESSCQREERDEVGQRTRIYHYSQKETERIECKWSDHGLGLRGGRLIRMTSWRRGRWRRGGALCEEGGRGPGREHDDGDPPGGGAAVMRRWQGVHKTFTRGLNASPMFAMLCQLAIWSDHSFSDITRLQRPSPAPAPPPYPPPTPHPPPPAIPAPHQAFFVIHKSPNLAGIVHIVSGSRVYVPLWEAYDGLMYGPVYG